MDWRDWSWRCAALVRRFARLIQNDRFGWHPKTDRAVDPDQQSLAGYAVAIAVEFPGIPRLPLIQRSLARSADGRAVLVVDIPAGLLRWRWSRCSLCRCWCRCGCGLCLCRCGRLHRLAVCLRRGGHTAAIGHGLPWAAGQYVGHRVFLSLRHPQCVLVFHADLPCDILAAERLVRRQPGRRVGIGFLLVCWPVHREQIVWVIRQLQPLVSVELLRALLPRVGQRDDMVDLHGG